MPVLVAREENAALFQELADCGDPERERRRTLEPLEERVGLGGRDSAAARERRWRAVDRIDLAAGEGVVAAEELHAPVAPDHVDLERLARAGGSIAYQQDGRRRLGHCRRAGGVGHNPGTLVTN